MLCTAERLRKMTMEHGPRIWQYDVISDLERFQGPTGGSSRFKRGEERN